MVKRKTEAINLGAFYQNTDSRMKWDFTTTYLTRQAVGIAVALPTMLLVYYFTASRLLIYPLIVLVAWISVIVLPKLFPDPQTKPSSLLEKFAADNNIEYRFNQDYTSNGVIFSAGKGQHSTVDLLHGTLYGYGYNVYTHAFLKGGGNHPETKQYGVVEIMLPKRVPNIFLDYKKNNSALNIELLDLFQNKDELVLEGDFNKFFKVYAPKQYSLAVLTLLNPQFMQMMVEPIHYDVELIEDRAFIYVSDASVPIVLSEENIRLLYSLAETLILSLQKQLDTFTFHPKSQADTELTTI